MRIVATMATTPERAHCYMRAVESIRPQVDCIRISYRGGAEERFRIPEIQTGERCLILAIDDDIVYPSNYVQEIALVVSESHVACVHGWNVLDGVRREIWHFSQANPKSRPVDVAGGGTVAFYAHRFGPWEYPTGLDFRNIDDVVFSIEARRRGFALQCLARPADWLVPIADAGPGIFERDGLERRLAYYESALTTDRTQRRCSRPTG